MNAREHARLSRALIHACGGLDEIDRVKCCHLSRSRLGDFMIPWDMRPPNRQGTMGARAIEELEAYCGRAIYSRAMAEVRPTVDEHSGCVVSESCDIVGAAAGLLERARLAMADGKLTAAEKEELLTWIAKLETEVRQVRAAAEAVTT